ncbi:hypothetical protein F383_28619 [Gossypium arboreum]|uniref:Uncharacterized protein n=1 Tax=Gossypium arboreum TaxID=29729 RepID=A0A0B0PFA1_GOSAR|nr:hypothetical protein F383_28619 [Gossypium arboreum]
MSLGYLSSELVELSPSSCN